MKPYYQDSAVTIYHGDCREIIPQIGSSIDLVLTDPPYGMRLDTNRFANLPVQAEGLKRRNYEKVIGDHEDFNAAFLTNLAQEIFLWGADYYSDTIPNRRKGSWLVWDKKLPTMSDTMGSEFELCWVYPSRKRLICRCLWSGYLAREKYEERTHPTQKPLQLMSWCISLSKTNGPIIDPYMGSGTTLRAAKDLGRQAIGIEIEEKYCEIAARRMAQEVLF